MVAQVNTERVFQVSTAGQLRIAGSNEGEAREKVRAAREVLKGIGFEVDQWDPIYVRDMDAAGDHVPMTSRTTIMVAFDVAARPNSSTGECAVNEASGQAHYRNQNAIESGNATVEAATVEEAAEKSVMGAIKEAIEPQRGRMSQAQILSYRLLNSPQG